MNRVIVRIPIAALVCLAAAGQTKPVFEAVSIKSAPTPTPQTLMDRSGNPVLKLDASRLEMRNHSLFMLLITAFHVQAEQIAAPDFARRQYFDIQATLPAESTKEQLPEMMQSLLAERFKLSYHRESREYRITAVTVGKSGMKLARLPDDSPRMRSTRVPLPDGGTRISMNGKVGDLFPVMGSFGGFPQPVDETGLDGIYTWVQDQPAASAGVTFQEATHDSYRNMLEAAGLKLEMRTVPKETIVVDHIEKTSTEN